MIRLRIIVLFVFIGSLVSAQTHPTKPDYVGHIEYTKGNFGTYNYPMKGDSILVYLKDTTVDFIIFSKESHNPRNLEFTATDLTQVSKKMYDNIITADEIVHTGNFDIKYVCKKSNSYSCCSLYLTHYGDGNTAELSFIGEGGGTRLDDMFVASLIRFK